MATPILRTKLYVPPTRSELVPRPHLIEWLNAGLARQLVVIAAPAGFGKTTPWGTWMQVRAQPAAILQSDVDLTYAGDVVTPQRASRRKGVV